MPVVTEGVETEMQRQIVVEEGCTQLQGLLLGKPDIEPSIKLAARENFLSANTEAELTQAKRDRAAAE